MFIFDNPPLLFLILTLVLAATYMFLRINEEVTGKGGVKKLGISPDDAYIEMQTCLANRDHKSAQMFALKYLEADPMFNDLRRLLIKSYIDSHKEYDAINQLLILVKNAPDDVKAYLQLGVLYQNTNQNKKAINYYNEVLRRDDSNILVLKNLGQLYINERQMDSALKIYKQLLQNFEDEKDKVEFYPIMGDLYASQGENKQALDFYKKAFKYQPTNIEIVKASRKIYARLKDTDNMLRLSKKLIAMAPGNYDYYNDLIQALFDLKHYDEALNYANKAMELDSKDEKQLMSMIAKIYTYTGKADEAVDILENKVMVDPRDVDMVQAYAMAQCMNKNYEEGVKLCLDAIEIAVPAGVIKLQNTISNILCENAVDLLENGDTGGAFEKFTEAVQYNSDNPEIYFKLCDANRRVKNYSEALKQCKRAIELSPEDSRYYVYLGDIYVDLQNYIEAIQHYKEAVDIDPRNATAHAKLGILQAKGHQYEAGIKSLQATLSIDENNPDTRYNLALIYELQGNIEEAKIEYKKVLSLDPNHAEALNNLQILGE